MLLVVIGVTLILVNMRDNIIFYYTPTEAITQELNESFRVGGLVQKKSIIKHSGSDIEFIVTDGTTNLLIKYQGSIPALFKEGQGAIATGKMDGDMFIATELLAKHDENYSPPKIELDKAETEGATP